MGLQSHNSKMYGRDAHTHCVYRAKIGRENKNDDKNNSKHITTAKKKTSSKRNRRERERETKSEQRSKLLCLQMNDKDGIIIIFPFVTRTQKQQILDECVLYFKKNSLFNFYRGKPDSKQQ